MAYYITTVVQHTAAHKIVDTETLKCFKNIDGILVLNCLLYQIDVAKLPHIMHVKIHK